MALLIKIKLLRKLICNCGEEYAITSGVLTAGKLFEVYKRKSLEDSISDYIHETDTAFWKMFKEEENGRKRN